MVRPERLRPGDTVGIVSPSWGGAGAYPHRVQAGVAHLEALGFKVELGRHALNQLRVVSDTPENRAADIHDMFLDPQVRAIIAAIGGDHSCHILPLLDFHTIRSNPTIFMGYSDITVLNVAIWTKTGMVTFNGPALLTDFAEHPSMFEYTESSFVRTLCRPEPAGVVEPSPWCTEETLSWPEKKDLERSHRHKPSEGPAWLRPGRADGVLVGGCLSSLEHLRGTEFWPDFADTVLFLETSEEKPSPTTVDGILMDYENMGIMEKISGLLFGRPMRYSSFEKQQLYEVILDRTSRFKFPIMANMDFGHTAPQFVLPIGCRARIDASASRFEILEAAVS